VGMEWLITFIIVLAGPVGIQKCGWKFYLLFCVGNVCQVIFVFLFVKETKGLTLEEIDILYAKPDYKPELEERMHARTNFNPPKDELMVTEAEKA